MEKLLNFVLKILYEPWLFVESDMSDFINDERQSFLICIVIN